SPELYALSLHDALPILARLWPEDFHEPLSVLRLGELAAESLGYDFHSGRSHTLSLIAGIRESAAQGKLELTGRPDCFGRSQESRSEEHTSELQSRENLV